MANTRVDWLLPIVATELGLTIVGELGGGEFGAALVKDQGGRDCVLKAMPGEEWAPRFARGAELSGLVGGDGYPVPRYFGTGVAAGAAWSLQEQLPGAIPDVMTEAHARQLVGFLDRHTDAADRGGSVVRRFDQELGDSLARLGGQAATSSLGRELASVLATATTAPVRSNDVVHGDFHHRNFLAVEESVTGVFDWELAWAGDWRIDLVNLACWGSWVPWQIPPPVSAMINDVASRECEPAVLAVMTAFHTTRAVEFNLRVHPDRLDWLLDAIETTTRSWLR